MRALLVISLLLATSSVARAQPGVLPSLRLSMGIASAERPPDRAPGFAGHMDLGVYVFTYRSATNAGPMLDTLGDVIASTVGSRRVRSGVVGRLGLAYDRTGPGGRAARDFALTMQVGFGYSLLHLSIGTAFLAGRVDEQRGRGVRLNGILCFAQGLVFVEMANDFWFVRDARLRDFRAVAGVDVLVFGAQITRAGR